MSEQEIYEIARQRINQRQRRWTLWALDLFVLILTLALLISVGDTGFGTLAAAIFFAWGGVFTFHTIMLGLTESRTKNIEGEVAKLRAALDYEKPKRLELSDDGELVDMDEVEPEKNRQYR